MSRNLASFLLLIIVTVTACKKNTPENLPEVIPPKEKKWVVTTLAGDGTLNFAEGSLSMSKFKHPFDVVITDDETIYVADFNNNRIRKISFE